MMSRIESLGTGTGKIVYSTNDCEDILRLSKAEILELFKSSGIVLFRGFGVTPIQMKAFSEKVSCSFIGDPIKISIDSDKFVKLVEFDTNAIPPHADYAFTPFRPDVIWFCCTKAPVKEGETLFWDGVQIWKEMSQDTKQLFMEKKIKFSWANFLLEHLNEITFLGETLDDAKPILDKFEGLSYQINEDSTFSAKYTCSAVVKTKSGNQDAFANDILGGYKALGDEDFEDGSKLPNEVADEIQKLYDKFTQEISWQAGDLVMMDNWRFTHGRRELNKDNQRKLFTILTNLSLN